MKTNKILIGGVAAGVVLFLVSWLVWEILGMGDSFDVGIALAG